MHKEKACPCGQAEDPRAQELRAWIAEHRDEPGVALPALQKAQEVYGFLPVEAQRLVAGELGKPLSEIYGIATFVCGEETALMTSISLPPAWYSASTWSSCFTIRPTCSTSSPAPA